MIPQRPAGPAKKAGAVRYGSGAQHVDLYRKLLMRRQLLQVAGHPPGVAYVPFIGDGDIAVEMYSDRTIYGADLLPERVKTAASRLTGTIVVGDCKKWPFPKEIKVPPIAVADLDAFDYPYETWRWMIRSAPLAPRCVVFFTDAQRMTIARNGIWHEPDGRKVTCLNPDTGQGPNLRETRKVYNLWWAKHIRPWWWDECKRIGYRAGLTRFYTRGMGQLYWGAVIDRI